MARYEKGNTHTQVDTLLKILHALGKTLAVVDIKKRKRFNELLSKAFVYQKILSNSVYKLYKD